MGFFLAGFWVLSIGFSLWDNMNSEELSELTDSKTECKEEAKWLRNIAV